MNQFWMVWHVDGGRPTFKHESETAALAECERLARLNPGEPFVVFEAIHARKVDSMQRIDLRVPAADDIPF